MIRCVIERIVALCKHNLMWASAIDVIDVETDPIIPTHLGSTPRRPRCSVSATRRSTRPTRWRPSLSALAPSPRRLFAPAPFPDGSLPPIFHPPFRVVSARRSLPVRRRVVSLTRPRPPPVAALGCGARRPPRRSPRRAPSPNSPPTPLPTLTPSSAGPWSTAPSTASSSTSPTSSAPPASAPSWCSCAASDDSSAGSWPSNSGATSSPSSTPRASSSSPSPSAPPSARSISSERRNSPGESLRGPGRRELRRAPTQRVPRKLFAKVNPEGHRRAVAKRRRERSPGRVATMETMDPAQTRTGIPTGRHVRLRRRRTALPILRPEHRSQRAV